ncbi:MAG: TylF/MycF/NovP-related O-methyltransferase [Baekduia sp.]
MRIPRHPIRTALNRAGYELVRLPSPDFLAETHPDLANEEEFVSFVRRVFPYTMTTVERMWALYEATRYVHEHGIEGSIVECGVWRGGSTMIAALTLQSTGDVDRDIYLYDTFEGMSEPSEHDRSARLPDLADTWDDHRGNVADPVFAYAAIEDVRANLATTEYPAERLHFVQGKVEDTIPETLPGTIALLRLDTDWYESTRHELTHLYPLLAPGGILIIDDYGDWDGARRAVDEWRDATAPAPLMQRIDQTGRLFIKPA